MSECTLSKEQCLEQRYYDEKYFVYQADENGYLSIYDRETGVKIKTLKWRKREKVREEIFN
ncbi:MAG: hypothetical protein IJX99_05310 [Clostridia bacterium]|nr:hypothetical protein [Clostridia bacterium]MBQ8299267.1 hypothetical protein [Clostridia bacterium]